MTNVKKSLREITKNFLRVNQIVKQINTNAKHWEFYAIQNVIKVYHVQINNNKKMLSNK